MGKKRLLQSAGLLLGVIGGATMVYLLRPPCLILRHTGLYCAGCGTQRMVAAMLSGDMQGAFWQNPFMFAALPLAGGYLLGELWRYAAEKPPLYRGRWFRPALLGAGLLALAFTVLRNLPGFAFLGPR